MSGGSVAANDIESDRTGINVEARDPESVVMEPQCRRSLRVEI